MTLISFDATLSKPTETVVRTGKLFETGDYPDKGFSLTVEEMAEIVAAFEPVPVKLQHTNTVLDGHLGELQAVEIGPDGTGLFGTVALPAWLDALLGDTGRKVSCAFDRQTKRLKELSLVLSPRITDAALMAAFTHATDPAGSPPLPPSGPEKKMTLMDMIKTALGAHADTVIEDAPTTIPRNVAGAATKTEVVPPTDPRLAVGGSTVATEPNPAFAKFEPEVAALKAKIAAFEQREREATDRRIATDAAAFAETEIVAEGRAYPAERAALVAQFTQAAKDDQTSPTAVTFGEGKTGSRVDALKAQLAARPPHRLADERMGTGEMNEEALKNALFNRAKHAPSDSPTAERLAYLKSLTTAGQAALNAEKKAS